MTPNEIAEMLNFSAMFSSVRLCCPKHTNEAWRNCDQIEWFKFYVNVMPLLNSTIGCMGVKKMYVHHQDVVDRVLALVLLRGVSGGD